MGKMEVGGFTLSGRRKRAGLCASPHASMLAKLGICALSAGLVLAVKIAKIHGEYTSADAGISYAEDDASDTEERLGKLHFVELPGIIEVFASKSGFAVPKGAAASVGDDGALELTFSRGQTVSVDYSCKVAYTDEDDVCSVCLRLDDVTILYSGMSALSVERNQPLSSGDTLGSVGAGGILRVEVTVDGRPVDANDYFNLDG